MPGPQGTGDRTEATHEGTWDIVSASSHNAVWISPPTRAGGPRAGAGQEQPKAPPPASVSSPEIRGGRIIGALPWFRI